MFITGLIKESAFSEGDAWAIGETYIAEAIEQFHGKQVNVAWFIDEEPIDAQKILTQQVNLVLGIADGTLSATYSDVTGFLWVNEEGLVGGHDIVDIFSSYENWYGALIISEEPIDLTDLGEPSAD